MRLATRASQPNRSERSRTLPFHHGTQSLGFDRFREDLGVADSLRLDDERMIAGVTGEKDNPPRVPVAPQLRIRIDA
jgi:hypothetical protein